MRAEHCGIPLQKQAEIISGQMSSLISASAQPLHLSAQSLQAQSQPMEAGTTLACNRKYPPSMYALYCMLL